MATRADFEDVTLLGGLRLPEGVTLQAIVTRALGELNVVRPRLIFEDITGDGSDEYALQSTFVRESVVRSVRWVPDADYDEPAQYLSHEDYQIERADDDSFVIRTLGYSPTSSDEMVVEYTAPHVVNDSSSTVESRDEPALKSLIESMVLMALSNVALGIKSQATDALVSPDVERSDAFGRRAAAARAVWNLHFGLGGTAGGEVSTVRAAMAFADPDPAKGYGVGSNRYRHTHHRRRY